MNPSPALSTPLIPLAARGVIAVAGEDRVAFLQGLVSNDVGPAAAGGGVWAALLTAQGKFLHEFFIIGDGDQLLLDCEAARRDDLLKRLKLFKLRARVTLGDRPDLAVFATLAPAPAALWREADGIGFADPRHPDLGSRFILPADTPAAGDPAAWEERRLSLGIPDGGRDLEIDKSTLLENGFDELHGVAWDKGCYVGQELTARTKYRGLVKKRLVPVAVAGPLPAPGTPILAGAQEMGVMRSGQGGLGLALLRLEAIQAGAPLAAGAAVLTPQPPSWLRLPGTDTPVPTNG